MFKVPKNKISKLIDAVKACVQTYFFISINTQLRGSVWLGTKWGDSKHEKDAIEFALSMYKNNISWNKETEEQKKFVSHIASEHWNHLIDSGNLRDKIIGQHMI